MKRRLTCAVLALCLLLSGCAATGTTSPQRYSVTWWDVFDTVTVISGYADSEADWNTQMTALHADLLRYNQLYDIYNHYDGMTNLADVNAGAAAAPVAVEDEILNTLEEDMIQFEKENSISQLMNSIIFYISEHKQLVRLLFSDHGDPGFQNKLLLATQHWTMPLWQSRRPDYDAEALSSLHIYIVSGCMAVIRQWITGGFKESEEEISSMLEKLSASTSAGFLQGK